MPCAFHSTFFGTLATIYILLFHQLLLLLLLSKFKDAGARRHQMWLIMQAASLQAADQVLGRNNELGWFVVVDGVANIHFIIYIFHFSLQSTPKI